MGMRRVAMVVALLVGLALGFGLRDALGGTEARAATTFTYRCVGVTVSYPIAMFNISGSTARVKVTRYNGSGVLLGDPDTFTLDPHASAQGFLTGTITEFRSTRKLLVDAWTGDRQQRCS